MNHMSLKLFLVSIVLLLAGCATLNEEDCRLGDWYSIGLQDGQQGNKNRAAQYNKECAEYKVNVDLNEYKKGRTDGLKSYCTYENGVHVGEQNRSYNRVCPTDLAPEFLAGYQPYHNLASAKAKLREAERHVDNLHASLDDEELSDKQVKKIKSRIKSAKSSVKRAEGEVNRYEFDLLVHKIDRETQELNHELASSKVSDVRRKQISKRLDKLAEKRRYMETMQEADKTIRTLKDIADLF